MADGSDNPLVTHRAHLFAYVLHLVRDPHDAEEVYQEMATAVLKNPQMLERAGDVQAYLRGVARHLAAGRFNLKARDNEVLRRWTEWAWEADAGDAESEAEKQIQIEALRHCREKLTDRAREIVDCHYDEGLELKSIAEKYGLQIGAVKAVLFRARRSLADCIRLKLAGENMQ